MRIHVFKLWNKRKCCIVPILGKGRRAAQTFVQNSSLCGRLGSSSQTQLLFLRQSFFIWLLQDTRGGWRTQKDRDAVWRYHFRNLRWRPRLTNGLPATVSFLEALHQDHWNDAGRKLRAPSVIYGGSAAMKNWFWSGFALYKMYGVSPFWCWCWILQLQKSRISFPCGKKKPPLFWQPFLFFSFVSVFSFTRVKRNNLLAPHAAGNKSAPDQLAKAKPKEKSPIPLSWFLLWVSMSPFIVDCIDTGKGKHRHRWRESRAADAASAKPLSPQLQPMHASITEQHFIWRLGGCSWTRSHEAVLVCIVLGTPSGSSLVMILWIPVIESWWSALHIYNGRQWADALSWKQRLWHKGEFSWCAHSVTRGSAAALFSEVHQVEESHVLGLWNHRLLNEMSGSQESHIKISYRIRRDCWSQRTFCKDLSCTLEQPICWHETRAFLCLTNFHDKRDLSNFYCVLFTSAPECLKSAASVFCGWFESRRRRRQRTFGRWLMERLWWMCR